MVQLLKYPLALIALMFSSTGLFAKPRTVYLDKELKEALYTDYVEIVGYTDSTISFKEVANYEGFYSFDWMLDTNHIYRLFNPAGIFTARTNSENKFAAHFAKGVTGHWPAKGEEVLIVLAKSGYASLFAYKQGDEYRFWSPAETGSEALFCFTKPASKLEGGEGLTDSVGVGSYETCWSGCLLPVNKLTTYGRLRTTFTGVTMVSDGRALFVSDFSDDIAFQLDGIDTWDKKYLDKRITVEGILVQFVEGKSVIKDWKIIDNK